EAAGPFLPVHAGGWQERLAEDVGNLRAAADWFEQDPTAADDNLLFATALHWFWFGLGHYREGRRRIETALERSGGARSRARGRALSPLAMYIALQGERGAIGPVAEESVAILRETVGRSVDRACALVGLGQSRLPAGARAGVARADEEPLVHDHPGGRPGTDRGRSGRRRAGGPLARRGGQPARGSRGRPTAARARNHRPSRRIGSCQPRRSGVRSGVPGGASTQSGLGA